MACKADRMSRSWVMRVMVFLTVGIPVVEILHAWLHVPLIWALVAENAVMLAVGLPVMALISHGQLLRHD